MYRAQAISYRYCCRRAIPHTAKPWRDNNIYKPNRELRSHHASQVVTYSTYSKGAIDAKEIRRERHASSL